ncbi:IclR family transcriptional regulator domain-containing protein [Streptomyces alkaliphilus]|uniref:IclR family transcriptional regulator domain-containing protein n=1 Tax=Streptomyces alkaliphilus TaxID=1472722 RepID=UPI00117EAC42|nr:IclR family transcriptional regulator [Streptomyces alkaliphilus]
MALRSGVAAPFHSVRYALRLLETIAESSEGALEAELTRRTGLPPDRLGELLRLLQQEGYIHRLRDGSWTSGEAMALLNSGGDRRRAREEKLRQSLDRLRCEVGPAVYIGRYTDGEMTVPHVSSTPEMPAVDQWVEFRSAAHATAIGKCLLGQLDHDGRRDHFSRHRVARLTSRTITDRRALLTTLDHHPASMPMLDLQEYAVGTVCAAVPLTAGASVGCLALSLPLRQGYRLREAAETLNRRAAPTLLSLVL